MSKKTVNEILWGLKYGDISVSECERQLAQLLLEEMPEKKEHGIFAELYVGQAKEYGIKVDSFNQAIDQVTDKIKAIFGVGEDE